MSTIDLNNVQENSGSDFFSFPEGDTKIRILTEFEEVKQLWEGEYPNSKSKGFYEDGAVVPANHKIRTTGWAWSYVYDIKDLKIITFPMSIIGKVAALKKNEEYAFDGMPMPYDITISNSGEGGNRYSVTPARKNTEIDPDVLTDLEQKTSITEIIGKIKEKQATESQMDKVVDYPDDDAKADKF